LSVFKTHFCIDAIMQTSAAKEMTDVVSDACHDAIVSTFIGLTLINFAMTSIVLNVKNFSIMSVINR